MSYHVSIPKKVIYDQSLRDVDLRLYLIIAENVNEHGFSEIGNTKLIELCGKSRSSIQRSLKALEDAGFIVVKHDVKKNDVYGDDLCRVIWLDEAFSSYERKKQYRKPKTIENDFRMFREWLKTSYQGKPFSVRMNGLSGTYMISKDTGYLVELDSHDGQREKMLRKYESYDIYRFLWDNRADILPKKENDEQ